MDSNLFKRVENALQESEELTQAILDSAFDAIISMDADGKVRHWNKRAEILFGWSSSDIIGKTLSDTIIPPRYRKSHENGLERFLTTGNGNVINQQIEISALNQDGNEFPVEISISSTPWENSFIFNGIIRDISVRKKAEELAAQKTEEYEVMHEIAKLLHSAESLDSLFESTMNAITHSKAFNFENDAGIFLTKISEIQNFNLVASIGKFTNIFSAMDEGLLLQKDLFGSNGNSKDWSINNCCLLDPDPSVQFHNTENKGLYIIPLQARNELIGLIILFASKNTPSYERNKEVLESIGGLIANAIKQRQCEDEMVKKNEEMAVANGKLKELNELKNRFLGIASHDLRNPLYLIKSYSEILKDELKEKINHSQQTFVEKIFASSNFMESLLDNLLDISKIESGKYNLNKKEEDLNEITKNQMDTHKLIAKKKNITISLNLGKITKVYCDKNAITQIMGNFIGNAIKFSPTGSKITVKTARKDKGVRFSVQDEGPGICMEEQILLFNEFQTLSTQPTGGEKSTGLGLAIVKKLVNLHGGKVGVNCKEGKGSLFYFDLFPQDAPLVVETATGRVQRIDPIRPELELPHPKKGGKTST